jgi:hypothetical protein
MTEGYSQSSRREANTNRNSGARYEQSRTNSTNRTHQRTSADNDRERSSVDRSVTSARKSSRESAMRSDRDNERQSAVNNRTSETSRTNRTKTSESRNRTAVSRNEAANRNVHHSRNENRARTSTASNRHYSPAVVNRNANIRHIESSRQYRGTRTVHRHVHNPKPKSYRIKYYSYHTPTYYNRVVWSRSVHYNFCKWYPEIRFNWYPAGYRLSLVSAYYADHHIGNVVSVYGRVKEVFYSRETDEYVLYFGEYYPHHDFSLVVPGYIARKYGRRPAYYFQHRNIIVTGLVTIYNSSPEIVVKHSKQLDFYI